ncbi:MAG: response regulator [Elusimicrobiota bacterium]|jgi:CheY-like chemotaxis protein
MLALIADDEPGLLRIMVRLCTQAGLRTAAFADGPALLDAARTLRPDLVISDLNMPGDRDGLQACICIRAILPDTAFIIMTGNILRITEIQDQGFSNILLKPFTTQEVVDLIAVAIQRPFAIIRAQDTLPPCNEDPRP